MKKMILILIAVLVLTGCGVFSHKVTDTNSLSKIVNNITYIYDERTDICYAITSSATYGGYWVVVMTTVPFEKIKGKVPYQMIHPFLFDK